MTARARRRRAAALLAMALAAGSACPRPARGAALMLDPTGVGGVALIIDPCVAVDGAELARVFELEQQVVLSRRDNSAGEAPDGAAPVVANVRCDGAETVLRVVDPAVSMTIERRFDLAIFPPAMRPRLLALSLTELVAALSTAGELPVMAKPQPVAAATAAAPAPPRAPPWALFARGTGEWLTTPQHATGGVAIAAQRAVRGRWAAGLDIELLSTTVKASLGDVQATRVSAALLLLARGQRGRWGIGAGAGARLGIASVGGTPAVPEITDGRRDSRPFWGPVAVTDLRAKLAGPLVAQLALEGGVFALPVIPTVADRSQSTLSGPWLKLSCGLGVTF